MPDHKTVTIVFELPDVKKEDVMIDVQIDRLIIFAEKKSSTKNSEPDHTPRERRFSSLSPALTLSTGMKVSKNVFILIGFNPSLTILYCTRRGWRRVC